MLGLIADVMLPEGQINKYIKSIFAIITIFVIVSPLPGLFNNFSHNANDFFTSNDEFVLNEDFLNEIIYEKQKEKQTLLQNVFEQNGIKSVDVNIICNDQSIVFKIESVQLDIKNMVIQSEDKNINIKDKLIELVYATTGVKASEVVFYE
ncbi:MAG: hypothetical protein IJ999_03075 [Clostridia bacterium]|nr:hypothetical protein [Clostridia bacterium]